MKKMEKKTKIILIICSSVLALILVLIGLRFLLTNKSSEDAVFTARRESYENVIDISGTVAAAQEQTLQALSAGTVTDVYVKAGDFVKKGDVIIQLDDSEQIYNLERQQYSMDTKKVNGSPRELKLMETERLSLIQKVKDRKVVATFDGIIADLDVSVGDSLGAKDVIGTLVNVEHLTATVEVTERDVGKLKLGQEVDFNFPAYREGVVKGIVTGWPAIGKITNRGATVVDVKLRIDDYPPSILPNYSFTGKIKISPEEDYVIVDRRAVGFDNGQAFVILDKTGKKIDVDILPYGRNSFKVTSGLEGGEVLKQAGTVKVSGSKASVAPVPVSSKKSTSGKMSIGG